MWFGGTVGEDHAFMNKVMVVGILSETTAISNNRMFGIPVVVDALILPFPNGPAEQARVFIE